MGKKKEGDEEAADVEERSVVENGALESGLEGAEDPATNKKKKPKKKKGAAVQTDPPTVAVKDLFPSGQFPEGQILEHPIALSDTTAKNRFNSEEARAIDRLQLDMYNEIRQAAEAHRQTRQYIQKWVKPGMKMIDICNELEKTGRALINENGLEAGLAFPTGCSRNHVAAHIKVL